ncbi:MAG: NAD(P)/FAD-dependent oxidoreductase [Caldilineaceae bacterium]|nr:NAD(P)/FAD-dependent oxidoreductase [Caldilineaceae bacterium]
MSQYDYDAIIVGAGHNGLIVAATLAKAGQSVLLLEKQAHIGGAAQTRELFPGCHFNVGAQEAGLLRQEIVHALGLTDHGLTFMESPATHFAPQPDGRALTIWRDLAQSRASIQQFSAADAARFADFVAYLQQMSERLEPILRQRPSLDDMGRLFVEEPELVRLATIPLSEFLDNWFEGNALKGILGGLGVSGMMRGPYAQGGVFMLLYQAAQGNGGLGGGRFVQGGMGQLAQALATAARAHGAEMRTNAAVASILLEEERAIGVRLDNGQEVSAAAVFSSLDARHTFFTLVGAPNLPPSFVRRVRSLKYRGCTAQVHLALRGLPDFRGATDKTQLSGHIVLAPGLAYLERAYDAAKYGDFSPNPYLDIVIPSLLDPTLAPTGQQVMSITMQYAPYDLRGKCWDDLAEPLGDAVLAALEQIAPGVGALVNQRRVMTPLDWEREWGLTEGNIYQGEMSMEQMFAMRPTPSGEHEGSPIKKLFLCGAAAHPGGGLTGLPGWTTGQLFTQNEHA